MTTLVITGSRLSWVGKLHPAKTSMTYSNSLIGKQSAQLRSANSRLKRGIEKVNQIKLPKVGECTVKPFPNFGECHYPETGRCKIARSDLTGKNQASTLNQLVSWLILAFTQIEEKAKGWRLKRDPQIEDSSSLQFPPMVEINPFSKGSISNATPYWWVLFQLTPMGEVKQNQHYPYLDSVSGGAL